MAKFPKSPALGGSKQLFPTSKPVKSPGFELRQSRMLQGLKSGKRTGGKPKLFPGRTGGR